jgi:hypothetical protein
MLSNSAAESLLKLVCNATTWTGLAVNDTGSPLTNLYLNLHSALPGRSGNQGTSVATYGNYAAKSVARSSGALSVSSTGIVTLVADQSFPQSSASGNSGYLPCWSLGTTSGAGVILFQGALIKSGTAAVPCTATTTDTITAPAHGAVADDRVLFMKGGSVSLPAGLTEGTVYWVRSGPTTDTLTVSATQGGAAVDITAAGSGVMYVLNGFTVDNSWTPTITTATQMILV